MGTTEVINQDDLTVDTLLEKMRIVIKQSSRYVAAMDRLAAHCCPDELGAPIWRVVTQSV
jgi:hypothetical protein